MTRYVLSDLSSPLPVVGNFRYDFLDKEAARGWWLSGPVVVWIESTETCRVLGSMLGVVPPEPSRGNRGIIRGEWGDECLVFRLPVSLEPRRLATETTGGKTVEHAGRTCEFWLLTSGPSLSPRGRP